MLLRYGPQPAGAERAPGGTLIVSPGAPSLFQCVRLDWLRVFLIAALISLMPVSRVIEAGGKNINFAVADAFLPLAALLLLWGMLTSGIRMPLGALFCISIAVICASSFYNLNQGYASRGPVSIGVEFVKLLSLWLYFYAVVNIVRERRDLLLALKSWILSSVVVSLIGIGGSLAYQITGVENSFALMYRAMGTFGDSNLYAAHLSLSLFLTLLYRRLMPAPPLWTWGAILILLAGIFFSASRGSMLALTLGLAALWMFRSSLKSLAMGAIALVCAGAFVLAVPGKQKLLESTPITARLGTTTVDLDNPEARQRRELWERAFMEFLTSPVLGIGRGNYGQSRTGRSDTMSYAHNTYLGLLCEIGITGFLCYAAVVGALLWSLIRAWIERSGREDRIRVVVILCALFTVALDGVTINIENYRGLWIVFGFIEVFRRLYLTGEGAPGTAEARGCA